MTGKQKAAPLRAQSRHWERTYSVNADLFGEEPSEPGRYAAALFRAQEKREIAELGAGQGRDTLFFAHAGLRVHALDYAEAGLAAIQEKAAAQGLSARVAVRRHDVRQPLPFADGSLDACYAHMLFCMALTGAELTFLAAEVRRVLRPGGLCVYSVRSTADPHYGQGIHRGEDLYENGGFIVHFFSREKVLALAEGYEVLDVTEFEEGGLPRRLFRVTLMKTKPV